MSESRIFLSHSHQDNAWCSQLVEALVRAGYDVWFDMQGLYVGDQWIQKIEAELGSREVFLVVLSPDSWSSPWVQRELHLALDNNRRILGIKYRDVDLTGRFIATYQILDAIGRDAPSVAQRVVSALREMPTSAPAPLSVNSSMRTDGVYAAPWGFFGMYEFLRFYATGSVGRMQFSGGEGSPREIALVAQELWGKMPWWSPMGKVEQLKYSITGNQISWTDTDKNPTKYTGTVDPSGATLDVTIQPHKGRPTQRLYKFVPATFTE